MPMRALLIADPLPAAPFEEALLAAAPDMDLLCWHPDLDADNYADVDAVLAWRFPRGVVERLPRLRWVCAMAAGVEKLLVPALPASVAVSRIVDAQQGRCIAHYVAAMALRHARQLPLYEAQQRRHDWTRNPVAGALDCTVGVLGTGEMGREVARLLEGIDFTVLGWSRRAGGALTHFLPRCDIVVCALPLTADTADILDARAFAAMKCGSYLINVARGGHVVERELIAAVQSGHLAGAALDVQQREPMPADDPLWDVPGITITPHIAAQSTAATIAAQFAEGWRALQAGAPLPRRIDRVRGY
jgi:phosphoglycerate dehydrogenase-like enzyme